ncbi:serine hydrolase domain-containing protein [Gorillibacterium timonense]|uniref:serine hydrolase domain-containing protein n=1 Tax=Gorillibacterium timonense TaxID=1689269 RepID=UPI00071CBEE5|nr:serine hydrolase [Gorillibacterium timonense]
MAKPGNAIIHSYLPRITPEEAGVSSRQIKGFLDAVHKKGIRLHTFLAVREGKVFAEAYFPPYTPTQLQQVFSLSKSFTSVAVGMAVEEGRLKLTDHVVSFFPANELPKSFDPKLKELTVRDLLRMATGQAQERWDGSNWVHSFFSEPVHDEKSGQLFRYNTLGTHMCSVILHKLGIDLEEYLLRKLILPLGIEGTRWLRSPQKIGIGGFGLSLIPELIAKFGILLLQEGRWEGVQLVPAWYVHEATSHQIDTVAEGIEVREGDWAQGYGYQFWQCTHGSFRGDGMYSQFCVVTPDKKTVFAATSFSDDYQGLLDVYYEYILEQLADAPLPVDPVAAAELAEHYPESGEWHNGKPTAYSYPAPLQVDDDDTAGKGWDGLSMQFRTANKIILPLLSQSMSVSLQAKGDTLLLRTGRATFQAARGTNVDSTVSYKGLRNTRYIASYATRGTDILEFRLFLVEHMEDLLFRFQKQEGAVELTLFDVHNGQENVLLNSIGSLK